MTKKGVVNWWISVNIVNDRMACLALNAKCQYLSNSEADFEVFRPTGATLCTDGDGVKLSIDCKKLQPKMEI